MAGYMGKSGTLDDAIASFAMAYAQRTNADHAALVAAKTPSGKPVGAGKRTAAKRTKAG